MNFLKMALIFLALTVFSSAFSPALARFRAPAAKDVYSRSMKDLATVLGFGAAGGIIGLSTLSFRKRPGRHLKDITTSGALGIIAGVVFIVYKSYNETATGYEDEVVFINAPEDFSSPPENIAFVRWRWSF